MQAVEEHVEEPVAEAPRRRPAVLVHASYLVLATVVLIQLWLAPNRRVLAANEDDHGFFLYVLAHGERVLFHGANPFFSDRLNVPDGVNVMANTTVLALSLPVAPVTHLLGPAVALVLLLTLGLAGTASAWYVVLRRTLGTGRRAAWIGGLWCGFCPAMITHANGHVNFVSTFVVPFLVAQVLRLREPGRARRGGVVLGLLIVLQVFINEEILLFTALSLGVFVITYALLDRAAARAVAGRVAAGLGWAALTSAVLLAYPLWWQFLGPGHYRGQPFTPGEFVTDLLAVGAYARQSLAGTAGVAGALSASPTEENTFFGLPMVILLVVAVRLMWASLAARATAVTALVLLVASMGPHLRAGGWDSPVPLPFALIAHVPVIDLVSVTRFAMVPATLAGVLLALAVDRAGALTGRHRTVFWVALVVALVPVAPKPLPVVTAPPLPPFVADGIWRSYVPAGRSLVTVPLPEVTTGRTGMRWAALSRLEFGVPRGYFMGPKDPPADRTGSWNAPRRHTSDLLERVRKSGRPEFVTEVDRRAATTDLVFWRAAVVVLVPDAEHLPALRSTVTALLGREPQLVGGVLLWDVRDLPVPPRE